MSNSLKVIQPNVITSARYDYSVTEKRVIYHIIKNIQEKMVSGLDHTLFGDMILHIPMKDLVTHDNYRRVKANLISLRKKSFTITTWIDPTGKGEDGWLDVGFIKMLRGRALYLVIVPAIRFFGDGLVHPLYPGTILIRDMNTEDVPNAYILFIGAGPSRPAESSASSGRYR